MKKKLFLLFSLLLSMGLTATAQVAFQTSDAPTESDWSTNTHWYRIKNHDGDYWLSTKYASSEELQLTSKSADGSDAGLWCIVGDASSGYTIYNKGAGVTKKLGLTGSEASARCKMYASSDITSDVTTTFYITKNTNTSSTNGNGYCFRTTSGGNNCFNKRDNYLALWENGSSPNCNGSTFTFYETTLDPTTLFTYVESVDKITDATWQAITSKSSVNSKYYWNAADGTNITTSAYTGEMDEFPESAQWAFVGNATDGFKIYNRAAKKYVSAVRDQSSSANQFATLSSDGSTFYAYTSWSTIENSFLLTAEKDSYYFLNWADNNGVSDGLLLYSWNAGGNESTAKSDVGNSIVAVSAQELIEAAKTVNWSTYETANTAWQALSANLPSNCVGLPTADEKTALSTAVTNRSDYATAKKTYNGHLAACAITAGYYRIINAQHVSEGKLKYLCPNDAGSSIGKYINTDKAIKSVVKIEASGDKFTLSLNGKSVASIPSKDDVAWSVVDPTASNVGKFTFISYYGTGAYSIQEETSNNHNYLHDNGADDGHAVVRWVAASGINDNSAWYIVPATDVDITLNQLNGTSYATAYLPFPATIAESETAKAYTGKLNYAKTMLGLTEVSTIPSATGVVVIDEQGGTSATLAIQTETTTADEAGDLTGTYFPITLTGTQKTQYLVFGRNNDKVAGFFYPGTNLTTIGWNKAYLDNSTTSAVGLSWGGNVTSIENAVVNTAASAAPVYDLSGRRVAAPAKGGVYIQNGRKFIK